MEVGGATWAQIIASIGILTPLVLGILGFIERRSKQAKKAEEKDTATPTVVAGEAVDPTAATLREMLREQVAQLELRISWVAEERDYYHRRCVDANLDVPAPRVEV